MAAPDIGTLVAARGTEFSIPPFDAKIYVISGGLVQTITYKRNGTSGTTVAVVTFSYDGSNNITSEVLTSS